jgi:TonB-linked SusC/RagA family outer membrane protein
MMKLKHTLLLIIGLLFGCTLTGYAQNKIITGTVTDSTSNKPVVGVNILVVGTSTGGITDKKGKYSISVPSLHDTLRFSYIGYNTKTVPINGRTTINVALSSKIYSGKSLVVVGYGTQQKQDITGAISSVNAKEIGTVHAGATVSNTLAGSIPGVSFRKAEGRPGSSASIQIRNMGTPLFVIDGVIEDEGQFNNLSPGDIKSISVLKGAQAAIYGSRAANGVVVVTTKQGSLNTPTEVSIDAYYGWQNLTRYINNVLTSAWKWKKYAAEAQINTKGATSITPQEIQKWKNPQSTDFPVQFESFNWPAYIFHKNAPQASLNIHASGGSNKTNYYISFTRFNQDAVFYEYNFNRTNAQVNVTTKIKDNLEVGVNLNGRVEERIRPGVPGFDDYGLPLIAAMENKPTTHPFANNNPNYLASLGSHSQTNAAFWTYKNAGKWQQDWRVLQTVFHATYNLPVKGLSIKGQYSYYFAHQNLEDHEYTYNTYTYNPVDSTYTVTGGSGNPWQSRIYQNVIRLRRKGQLDYKNSFGKHSLGITMGTQWTKTNAKLHRVHDVPPVNELNIVFPKTVDSQVWGDHLINKARIGYYGRITYNYAQKYILEFSGREDASWKFPPHHRWGFFPGISGGWRISKEPFFQSIIGKNSALTNLKFRISWGKLGDDNIGTYDQYYNLTSGIGNYAYVPGYNYGVATYIFGDQTINTSSNRGIPVTNITWFTSTDFDAGLDFGLWGGKLSGSLDYFHRKRTGLLGNRYKAIIPAELGYSLPQLNQNSDANVGGEASITYKGSNGGTMNYQIKANFGYSRHKFLHSVNPVFGNSWDQYRNSSEERWTGLFWGYQVLGQFKSQKQINNYPVNIDGHGNTTLLPGDLIYKDVNGDGVINGYDVRPLGIGQYQPIIYGGLQLSLGWKGIDFRANFSYGGLNWFNRNYESKWPFQNNGNLLKDYLDRWHRKNPRDPNSKWIPGKYPPLRFNDSGHSNYNKNSTFWLINVRYFRLRTMEVGYTFPKKWTNKVKLDKARIYVNTYNLFSIDNMPSFLDPAVASGNGLQYPQNKFVNIGINIVF